MDGSDVTGDDHELAQQQESPPRILIPEKWIRILGALGQLAALITVLIQRGCS